MPTPVLIPAHNEANYLHKTLDSLPRDCSPVVIANGCSDKTAQIAKEFGNVALIVREEAGKLPAIQAGLRSLGKRATEPLIFLDGDTRPLMCNTWLGALCSAIKDKDSSAFIVGPLILDYPDPCSRIVKSAVHNINQWKTRNNKDPQGYSGANTAVRFTDDVLEDVLALPHIWPGEDRAMKDVVVKHGGRATKLQKPGAVAMTSSDRYPNLFRRLRMSKQEVTEIIYDSYLADAAPGSISYNDYVAKQAELQAPKTPSHLEKAA